jgi:hypothetical protein
MSHPQLQRLILRLNININEWFFDWDRPFDLRNERNERSRVRLSFRAVRSF